MLANTTDQIWWCAVTMIGRRSREDGKKVREQWVGKRQGRKLPGRLHVTTLCEGTYPGNADFVKLESPGPVALRRHPSSSG